MTRKIPFSAFDDYFSMHPRSYDVLAQKFGVSKRAIVNRAIKERWQERVEALERKTREAVEKRTLESLEQMAERHLRALRVIQVKALQALQSQSFSSASASARALIESLKAESVVRGQPSERSAISIEEVVRREYERWLGEEEAGDDQREAETPPLQ